MKKTAFPNYKIQILVTTIANKSFFITVYIYSMTLSWKSTRQTINFTFTARDK